MSRVAFCERSRRARMTLAGFLHPRRLRDVPLLTARRRQRRVVRRLRRLVVLGLKLGVNTGESGTLGATSVTGGAQIGYNWLISAPLLFGLEADISGAGLTSTTWTSPPGSPLAVAGWND